ncbi:MAG TPA: shikimate kinase, partial [Solirubrobacteraceae bacterium]|nr:shikimate kinase [Solirubrobacteraceae bacterium]
MAGVRMPGRAIVFIGFMGAGKSTAAAELAAALGGEALDSDALLEQRLGHPLAREFELHGEQAFRALEEELVCDLLNEAAPDSAIALGGGSVLSERVRAALEGHVTVLLDVDPQTAWERVQGSPDGATRPLARQREDFLALHTSRRALYEGLADTILTDLSIGGIAATAPALRALAASPTGTRLLWASAASGQYPVLIGRGLLSRTDGRQPETLWPLDRSRSRAFCVSDDTVAALYGDSLGALAGT